MIEQTLDDDSGTGCIYFQKSENWQRFILLGSQTTDMPLTKLSPFAIQKIITGIAEAVKDVKKARIRTNPSRMLQEKPC